MKKRKLWIPIVAVLLAAAAVAGYLLAPRMPKSEAAVFPVTMVGYTDYYSGTSESYGMVTTDKVQPLYISGTQTVTEILVYAGQSVKKGDVLYTYDTTLSDLAIERKDLANQQLEVELKTAQAELSALKKMKPIQYKPGSTTTTKSDYTKSPKDERMINTVYSTNTTGKASSSPLYFWLKTNTQVDDAMIAEIFRHAGDPSTVYVVFQSSSGNKANTEFAVHTGVKFTKVIEPAPTEPTTPPETTAPTQPTDPSEPSAPTDPTESSEPTDPTESSEPTDPTESPEPTTPSQPTEGTEPVQNAEAPAQTQPAADTPAPATEQTQELILTRISQADAALP